MKKRSSTFREVDKTPNEETDLSKFRPRRKSTLRNSSGSSRKKEENVKPIDIPEVSNEEMSREDLRSLLTPYDLVLAFERELMGGTMDMNPLSHDQIKILTAKETVKYKPKQKRKGIDEDESPASIDIDMDKWQKLDMAKKERRILEIVQNREDWRVLIETAALEAYPSPRKLKVSIFNTKCLILLKVNLRITI